MRRLHGLAEFVFDMVDETTSLVERTHMAVTDRSMGRVPPIDPVAPVAREIGEAQKTIARGVYHTIRAMNYGVRMAVTGISEQADTLTEGVTVPIEHNALRAASWGADQLQALANGLGGDYLRRRQNGLEIPMQIRLNTKQLFITKEALREAYPDAASKVCILVHGLACTEWVWGMRSAEFYGDAALDFGRRLWLDCGYTPIYVRYNSGRHVSENGCELSQMIGAVCDAYPTDISEIALIGHSMGGLVARNAAHHGAEQGASWVNALRQVFCIGSPHHGSPLERSAHKVAGILSHIETAATQVIGELLDVRSDGIKDLRHGYTQHEDTSEAARNGRKDARCVEGVTYYSLAATITHDPSHPVSQILGDWLVTVPSATGVSADAHIPFHATKVFGGLDHVTLGNHPDVYTAVRDWIHQSSTR